MVVRTTTGHAIHVRFFEAHEVCVLGKFNNWSTVDTPLTHLGDWMWGATLPLEADLAELRFFVKRQGECFGRLFRMGETGGVQAA